MLRSLYARWYRQKRPFDMRAVHRWDIPVAAARLADGIPEEVPFLLALLENAARS